MELIEGELQTNFEHAHRNAKPSSETVVTTGYNDELIQAFLDDRLFKGLSPKSITFYRSKLTLFSHRISVSFLQITKAEIQKGVATLQCNPGGKLAYLRAIKAFFGWAEESELIEPNPARRVSFKVPKPLRYAIKVEDVPTLIAGCRNIRDKRVMIESGVQRE